MKYWAKWANRVNTSLLVIVTHFNGAKTYSSAEEITYSPSWVLHNNDIQIAAKIDVIGKLIPINWSFIRQQIQEFRQPLEQKPSLINQTSYPYIVNITMQNIKLKPYSDSKGSYYPDFVEYVIHNVQIPVVWIKMSNNIAWNNSFGSILLCAAYAGYINFYAITNSSNYEGPYIGISFTAYPGGLCSAPLGFLHSLEKLDNPGYYIYLMLLLK